MILFWLILVPAIGAFLGWAAGRWARVVALVAVIVELGLGLILLVNNPGPVVLATGGHWLQQLDWDWMPPLGIRFHLALDGLSLWLILLTAVLGILAVLASWNEIQERAGFFYFNLLVMLTGVAGVFMALDLFLFYFFYELMLVPMFFLILIWGDSQRRPAAIKFLLFSQLSSLFMLVAILGLYFVHGRNTGEYTFDYTKLLGTSLGATAAFWLTLGFVAAFLVKLPAIPVHTWAPSAYASAPTGGSILLSGLLSKTGAYGLIRFVVPLFPGAAADYAFPVMLLGVIGILYGAMMAFGQRDLKRLIAYSSISHLGFVLLGIFAWNAIALQGAVMQMIAHGISSGALFLLAGSIEKRTKTRTLDEMGGLWPVVPRLGGMMLFFALASLGLPGLGNFIGEFLVLLGAFQAHVGLAAAASAGMVAAVVYALWMIQQIFYGPTLKKVTLPDLGWREVSTLGALVLVLLWLGLYPQPVMNSVAGSANMPAPKQTVRWPVQPSSPVETLRLESARQ